MSEHDKPPTMLLLPEQLAEAMRQLDEAAERLKAVREATERLEGGPAWNRKTADQATSDNRWRMAALAKKNEAEMFAASRTSPQT
jgi:hypothetical protein